MIDKIMDKLVEKIQINFSDLDNWMILYE
jgi:hypothetical protein